MSTAFEAAMKRAVAAEDGEIVELEAPEPKHIPVKTEDKTLVRMVMESSLYDNQPTARLILNQLSVLTMDEKSRYPKDAPKHYPDGRPWEKEGWCWMAQWELSMRCGIDSDGRTLRYWITRFRKDGTVLYREWYDDYGTHHAEYKVVAEAFAAFQRPDNKEAALAARKPRYREGSRKGKKNAGMFSKKNQPKKQTEMSAQRRAIMEEDGE
jgi:hypothetical protein